MSYRKIWCKEDTTEYVMIKTDRDDLVITTCHEGDENVDIHLDDEKVTRLVGHLKEWLSTRDFLPVNNDKTFVVVYGNKQDSKIVKAKDAVEAKRKFLEDCYGHSTTVDQVLEVA